MNPSNIVSNPSAKMVFVRDLIELLNKTIPNTSVSQPSAIELNKAIDLDIPETSVSQPFAENLDSKNTESIYKNSKTDKENLDPNSLFKRLSKNLSTVDDNEKESLLKRVIEESKTKPQELTNIQQVDYQESNQDQNQQFSNSFIGNVVDRQLSGLEESRKYLLGKIVLTKIGENQDKQDQQDLSLFDIVKSINSQSPNNTEEQTMLIEMLKEVDQKIIKLEQVKQNKDLQDEIIKQMREAELRFIEESLEFNEQRKKQRIIDKPKNIKAQNLSELFGGNSSIENSGLTYEIKEVFDNTQSSNQPVEYVQIVQMVDPLVHYQQKVSEIGQDSYGLENSLTQQTPSASITPSNAVQVGAQLSISQAPSTAVSNTQVSSLARINSLNTSTSVSSTRSSETSIGKPVLGPHTAMVVERSQKQADTRGL